MPDDQHARFARGGVIRAPGGEDSILARRLPGEQFFTRKQVEALAAGANVTLVNARTEADDA